MSVQESVQAAIERADRRTWLSFFLGGGVASLLEAYFNFSDSVGPINVFLPASAVAIGVVSCFPNRRRMRAERDAVLGKIDSSIAYCRHLEAEPSISEILERMLDLRLGVDVGAIDLEVAIERRQRYMDEIEISRRRSFPERQP